MDAKTVRDFLLTNALLVIHARDFRHQPDFIEPRHEHIFP
jgi:hypothetical protein